MSLPRTECRAIPRRMLISDPSQMPHDYSTTPGGTIYSTTPGGTKIVYERAFLMNLRNSPISQTPPRCTIPSGLLKGTPHTPVSTVISPVCEVGGGGGVGGGASGAVADEACEQFDMEM